MPITFDISKGDAAMEQKSPSLLGTVLVLLAGMSWGTSGVFVRYFTALGMSAM